MTDDEFEAFLSHAVEVKATRENLKTTQDRCRELLEENRALHRRVLNLEAMVHRVIKKDCQ